MENSKVFTEQESGRSNDIKALKAKVNAGRSVIQRVCREAPSENLRYLGIEIDPADENRYTRIEGLRSQEKAGPTRRPCR